MTIGEKITQRRLAAHLSQEILAERLGVSTQDVSRWESGEVLPDAEKLLQLCRVFGISADELLGENAKADDASDFLSLPLWRWSLRVISPPLAFAGTAAALTGLTGAVYHALTQTSGTPISAASALLCAAPGAVPFSQRGFSCWR